MPDFSICCNRDCPLRESCYRYRAVPSEPQQAYAYFEYISQDASVFCAWFMAIEEGDRLLSMDEME